MSMLKSKGCLFLASSLCDGLEDNDIKQVTTLLLNKEANPNTLIPTYGVTPFHLVIGNDSEAFAEEVTKLFLRHGGNPNVKSVDGLTPVHVAAAWGRITVLELLLANGGDSLCLDYEGRSPFHYAFDGKYYGAITVLSKYSESVIQEEKPPKYKITFDKLIINNGDTIAEYVALLDTHITNQDILNVKECQTNEENRLSNNRDKYFYFSDNSLNDNDEHDINSAELRLREEMDREKCLLNEIINQLSSSLNSNSKEADVNSEYKQATGSLCVSSSLSILNTDDDLIHDVKDKFSFRTKTKQRSVTPRYRRRIFGRNINSTKIPLIPLHDPSDSIISKSPNFLIGKKADKGHAFSSPKILSKKSKFKTYTPCLTRNDSFRSDEFNFGKEMARSTPRRKHCYRQYSSYRKFKRNQVLTSSESTSPNSTNSLSPEDHYPKLRYRFNKNFSKNLAVKLYENKYDDDMPESPNFNKKKDCTEEYNVMNSLIDECSSNLESLEMKEVKDIGRKKKIFNADNSLQEKYLEDLKANDTRNTFKENFNIFLSSFQSQSYISIEEEYKYENLEEGLTFLERRIYTLPPRKSEEDFTITDKFCKI